MRLFVFLLLLLAIVGTGLYLMYGSQGREIRIVVGPGARPAAEGPPVELPVGRSRAVIRSGERTVLLEFDRPPDDAAPVVLLLRGDEDQTADRSRWEQRANQLRARGYVTVLVQDHGVPQDERTGLTLAAIEFIREIANVGHERLAMVGFEEAAPLGLVAAALAGDVVALALHNVCLPNGMERSHAAGLPRVLLALDESNAAAVATRQTLEVWLRGFEKPYRVRPVERETAAWEHTLTFLDECLADVREK